MNAALPKHLTLLEDNAAEVNQLLKIHEKVAGAGAGRKHAVEVLNKSGIVLLVACWESYVEDLAVATFDVLLAKATSPATFPKRVLTLASKELRAHQDEGKIWDLAGKGWQRVLNKHRDKVLAKFVQPFNTPKTGQVNDLFENLVGARKVSSAWKWTGMSSESAAEKLDALVELRGSIAHRVKASNPVLKQTVEKHIHFVKRVAGALNNEMAAYVKSRVGSDPWGRYKYIE